MCDADPECQCGDDEDDCANCAAWADAYREGYCSRCEEWGTCKREPLECIQEFAQSVTDQINEIKRSIEM